MRDDFTPESDIIITFSKPMGLEFITLADELEDRFNQKVDLVTEGDKTKYLDYVEPEIVYV